MKTAAIVLFFIALSCVCDAVPVWHPLRSAERRPCEYGGVTYADGEKTSDPLCICLNGNIACA